MEQYAPYFSDYKSLRRIGGSSKKKKQPNTEEKNWGEMYLINYRNKNSSWKANHNIGTDNNN